MLKIDSVTDEKLTVESDLGLVNQKAEISLPCLLTVDKDIFEPRLPSYKRKLATKDKPIRTLTFADMPDQDPSHYGLNGSPTRVMRVFPPVHEAHNEVWDGDPEDSAGKLADLLITKKLI